MGNGVQMHKSLYRCTLKRVECIGPQINVTSRLVMT